MEPSIPTKNEYSDPRIRLTELIRTKVPDYEPGPTPAEAVDRDRQLVGSGSITENELLEFYADAWGLERAEEEDDTVEFKNRRCRVRKGSLIVLPPGCWHRYTKPR